MKRISILIVIALVIFAAVVLISRNNPQSGGNLKIAATIFPVYDIAKNIVGNRAEVVQVLPPGASPHTFEITPQSALSINGSKIVFKIGNGLDDWMDSLTKSGAPGATEVEVSSGIKLRKFADGSVDPHYWLDLNNAQIIAKNIAETMSGIDPAGKSAYQENLKIYSEKLSAADKEIAGRLANVSQKDIATFHDAWYYFANRYGLNVVASFEPFPGKEPTPQYLASFVDQIKSNHLKVVFIEPQFSSQSIQQIASDLNIALVSINPADGGESATDDFISIMKDDAVRMQSVLQ